MNTSNFPIVEFQEKKRLYPSKSDHTCFAEIIANRKKLSSKTIKKYFNILIDKDDYAEDEKRDVVKYLINLAHSIAE